MNSEFKTSLKLNLVFSSKKTFQSTTSSVIGILLEFLNFKLSFMVLRSLGMPKLITFEYVYMIQWIRNALIELISSVFIVEASPSDII